MSKPKSKKRLIAIYAVLLLLIVCGGGAWWWTQEPESLEAFFSTPVPEASTSLTIQQPTVAPLPSMQPVVAEAETISPQKQKRDTPTEQTEVQPTVQKQIPAALAEQEKSNLKQLTDMKAEFVLRKVQADIAEQIARSVKAQESMQPQQVPMLTPEIIKAEEPQEPPAAKLSAPIQVRERVISIQRVGNKASAIIRSKSGQTMTVWQGQKYEGGTVSRIDQKGVTVRNDNTNRLISFE